ncbi:MAG: hypothetical protein JO323_00205 [Acidobacteriia bacterium]|nr:hypothetical protein [Terriglobia bacterium]
MTRSWLAAAWLLGFAVQAHSQGRGGPGAGLPPKAAAPIDITGYWVSVVTEDWRFRMVTPKKGDYPSIPLNAEGRRVAQAWDPAKDEAAGEQCKSYGAGNVMRVPERLRISWEDDTTLRVDTDAGTQTRLFHFGGVRAPGGAPTWQGISAAQWELAGARGRGHGGDLKVVTTHMRPGYLQKNGVPYSENAVVTEYFNRTMEDNGDSWLIVTTMVEDPQYLTARFVRSTHFKKLADSSGWRPTECTAR